MASKSPKSKTKPKDGRSLLAQQALEWMDSLVLLARLFEDPAGKAFVRLLKWLSEKEDTRKGFRYYGRLWRSVMEVQEVTARPKVGDGLQDYWLENLLEDPNPFHLKSEAAPFHQVSSSLKKAYQRELGLFRKILWTDWEGEVLRKLGSTEEGEVPSWKDAGERFFPPLAPAFKTRQTLKEKSLSKQVSDTQLVELVGRHFYQNGWGLFGHSRAFRWVVGPNGLGGLEGIESADPIQLENLVGYDEARQPLIENIEAFVSGKGANNVLIYGERGTGKSSTVKALLNAYGDLGLRLVEVHPEDLKEYPEILRHLRGRREKFVLFVDDLSFEENETSYKGLKALLEGTVEATPENVILIATSNRRHLIREFFADREEGYRDAGEVHGQDTVEEKLSLSDRFGLVVSFYSPNQDTYLQIVEKWAKAEGIRVTPGELRAQALQWAIANNGRSGRTARQFVNHLKGQS
jgi:uncharacterized protein